MRYGHRCLIGERRLPTRSSATAVFECDIPLCPGISIWWEIIKIAVWVSVGIILQGLRGFSYLWQWKWPHVVSDPGLKGVVRDVEAREESVEEAVQELAQQQLQALRRRQASRQQ